MSGPGTTAPERYSNTPIASPGPKGALCPNNDSVESCQFDAYLGRTTVGDALKKKVTPKDLRGGYVYAYRIPEFPGLLKIGVTERSVAQRLKEWKYQCRHNPVLAYPKVFGIEKFVPHVYRVENLIKAELGQYRKKMRKCRCGSRHNEWFQIGLADAAAIIDGWSSWARQNQATISTALTDWLQIGPPVREMDAVVETVDVATRKGSKALDSLYPVMFCMADYFVYSWHIFLTLLPLSFIYSILYPPSFEIPLSYDLISYLSIAWWGIFGAYRMISRFHDSVIM